jgi:hypothetical protein
MATSSTHQRMEQVMSAILEGTAGAAMSQRARDWLLVRYTRWISRPGERGDARTPEEAWPEYESAFLAKFREIGSKAATASDGEIRQDTIVAVSREVESSTLSPCPFCPPPDSSGM